MSEAKPWYPDLKQSKTFIDHENPSLGNDPPLRVPDPEEDTAPLQGSKDLSDDDSLEDVKAASYDDIPPIESDVGSDTELDTTEETLRRKGFRG